MAQRSRYRSLPAALAAAEDLGISLSWVTRKADGSYAIERPKAAAAKPKRKRAPRRKPKWRGSHPITLDLDEHPACAPKTASEKRERAGMWRQHLADLRDLGLSLAQAEELIAEERAADLKDCQRSMAALRRSCEARRKKTQKRLDRERERTYRARTDSWKSYRRKTCGASSSRGRAYSAQESDSLALQNIPAEWHAVFLELARDYPLTMAPDARAEKFNEDVTENPGNMQALQIELGGFEDIDWAALEAEHYRNNPDPDDEIPF